MAEGLRFNFWIETSLKARLEQLALKLGSTQGAVIRDALATHLAHYADNALEQKHGELGMAKRMREILEAVPKDTHDGVMLVARIDDIIQKQIAELQKRGWLRATDYDHFIRLVEENRTALQTYAERDWLDEKLVMLVEGLRKKKMELELRNDAETE